MKKNNIKISLTEYSKKRAERYCDNGDVLGLVTVDDVEGALVKKKSGLYVQVIGKEIRELDQQEIFRRLVLSDIGKNFTAKKLAANRKNAKLGGRPKKEN